MDQSRLLACRATDSLANPPGRVSAEMTATPVIEFFGGAHQAQVAFLDQVDQGNAGAGVAARDGDDQAQIRLDQRATSHTVTGSGSLCKVYFFIVREQTQAANIVQVALKSIFRAGRLARR